VEAVVACRDGRLWKLARTFDDPATWSEPHVRHLSIRTVAGPGYRTEPIPDQWELYDLTNDPAEATNLAHDPGWAEMRARLESDLVEARSTMVPERHEEWPYAVRPDTI